MQRINLDFVARGRVHRWAGRVLLGAALVVAADAAVSYVHLSRAIGEAERSVARGQPRASARAAASPEELAAARETLQRLSLPWSGLFAALESAATDQVALLAIAPDPKTGKVLIQGDSKDYLAALSYVARLSRTPALAQVELVRHEVKASDPQRPVAFTISAAWKEAKQ